MTLRELLIQGINKLKNSNINNPQLILEIFLSNILSKPKEWIIANPDFKLKNPEIIEKFNEYIQRKKDGEPVEYIVGKKEFYSINLKVNKNVLIPRPETEILVEKAIKIIKKNKLKKIIDIGTGSGAIAIAIKKEVSEIEIFATDVSLKALKIAKENCKNFNINLICCDLFNGINGKFDLIISNPPYIKTRDLELLPNEVKKYEPLQALDGGEDGLKFYKKIIIEGKSHLNKNGYIVFEIGYISVVKKLEKMFADNNFCDIKIFKDYSNFPRVIMAKFL